MFIASLFDGGQWAFRVSSDNATYFTSQLDDKFMELFGCKPRFSAVLHPEGNSLVERMDASLEKMLANVNISQKYPKQWHKLLPVYCQAQMQLSPCIEAASSSSGGMKN